MFKKILIANRGEIALRVIRACRELGIQTVAIHSEADAASLHVRLADESVCVGPADATLSYRNIPNILSAAEITGAEAIHPGYGFLAENSHFAEVCESAGIKFIGPFPECISLMGDKAKARETMMRKGVPVIPGSEGKVTNEKEAIEIAKKIGYPVIVKAVAGGGGRGMRVVHRQEDLAKSLQTAQMEAKTAFGDDGVYIEKYFIDPRHIEVQVLADEKGKVIYLGERDCSIQRRHQKLIEESPSPVVDDRLRRELGRAALDAVSASHYVNAGTVEFLLDKDHNFYFIEMNTRIQVEHPITEMVSGIDLVKEQIKIAAGRSLEFKQSQVKLRGHSFECRINAEDPEKFTPSPGTITSFHLPGGPGVRVDSAIYLNGVVTPYYDSLIAKLIVHAGTRDEAIAKMRGALSEFVVEGIKTTLPLHKRVFDDPAFIKGRFSTNFLERFLSSLSLPLQ
ncbi:MAG: acetyl-CoA carboxylase biotin carboxylase subunit [Candidatus Manganitrophus sp.]|uniref:Biotin carboxylase n=1 Tax=Candidatus Manganitrophus noduliformans TaxID=2606439 RepID=A0A7X6DUE6_9BACT|nr:acetyl-CoA carboxylase biotin carboxylase subunit [Candidatus Manganitrophus noduliformans]MDC4205892.1 acetyl-CoA carboxylase biotin carboxylase subunit [Candidatus Manganitrophus sp.]NKE73188.1 acetyl-CoA carboxylase biotin carboxylase subunit [Candidatus Manganitrophus noduliformans]WDT72278.1 MAG: acetyl-CoA carboxylase biotin carboxylase subunit [Candidatus Manganitrophus sp.]WDT75478.1 MAG: acetyl-CoA carboxylase biotin carboxylase subunit [Candidatus Manganitrophus sp.]